MTKLLGIDISEHNGYVNWDKIKASGVKFAMIRASWGHFAEDKLVRRNVAECKRVGMPYGFYHYSYADTEANARKEAQNFLNLCKELGGYTYPLNLDMEDADHWKTNNGVGDDMNLKTIRIFKEVIEGAGDYLTLYMSKSWFDRLRSKNSKLIDSLDAWLAHWGIEEPSMKCGMWQYTSDGKVNGSSTRTDMNYAYKDYPSILANMKGDKPEEKPKPTPPTNNTQHSFKYAIGQKVRFSTCYISSTNAANKISPIPVSKMARDNGTITNQYNINGVSAYLLDNGLCFVNNGDIREVLNNSKPTPAKKSVDQVVNEIYRGIGDWGNNPTRRQKLIAYGGVDFADAVQSKLDKMF